MVLHIPLPDRLIGQIPFDFVQSGPVLVTYQIDNQIYTIMALFQQAYSLKPKA